MNLAKPAAAVRMSLAGLGCLGSLLAAAETPNPDRPTVSMSGRLIATDSLELESGVGWAPETVAVPLLLKFNAAQRLEFRLGANAAGFGRSEPGVGFAIKVPLVDEENLAIAFFAGSAIPLAAEAWGAQTGVLATAGVNGFTIQGNATVAFDAAGGTPGVVGVPLVLLVGSPPIGRCSLFVEGAGTLSRGLTDGILDAGAGCLVTDSLIADLAGGYQLSDGTPFLNAGVTTNFGRLVRSGRRP